MSQLSFSELPDVGSQVLCVLGLTCAMMLAACAAGVPEPARPDLPAGTATDTGQRESRSASAPPSWNLETLRTQNRIQPLPTLTLEQAWRLARQHDPDYRAALSGRAAALTEIRQGRAAILPQVQAGYSRSKVSGQRRLHGSGRALESELDYDSTSAHIQLQQPVFNIERYAQFQGGKARAQLGDAEFAAHEYDAAMRLVDAYLDTIAADGARNLVKALADSLEEQAVIQDALFERNETTVVDAQETRARLALARADVIAADDRLRVARRRLRAIIGFEPAAQASIESLDAHLAHIEQPMAHWMERALANGAAVRAAHARVRVADAEVRRALGRHTPTVDLVMALSDADSENLDALSQRSNVLTIGLQMAIPLYSGGYDTANHARSRHERRQAEHELAAAREQAAAEVVRQYAAVQGGGERIAALMSSVRAGEGSLEAARYGYEYGVNSNLDVLRRQDSLFHARDELLRARIAWVRARIALSAATGAPMFLVFAELDRSLQTAQRPLPADYVNPTRSHVRPAASVATLKGAY